MSETPQKIPIKAYTKKQLAGFYNVPVKQLVKWIVRLKDKELTKRHLQTIKIFTPAQVRRLFDDNKGLGIPDKE